jgi:dipeptidase E
MKLLLISNSTNYKESYLAWCQPQIIRFCRKHGITPGSKLIFIPFAGVKIQGKLFPESYQIYSSTVANEFQKMGFADMQSIHNYDDKKQAIAEADGIVVGGGNTFHLVAELHHYDLMQAIADKVKAGTPYIGWSAGANIACPTLCTTNDMPIVQPKSFHTLHLVPFQINPHYIDPYSECIKDLLHHGGESRMDRLNEYMVVNPDSVVVGLREASALWVEDEKATLKGASKMVVFAGYGAQEKEFEPESDVSFLLK